MKGLGNLLICLIMASLALSCSAKPLPPLTEGPGTNEVEGALWLRAEELQGKLEGSGILYDDPRLEDYLGKVVRRLQPPGANDQHAIRVKLIKDPHLNAFAFPNGVIYLHTGILARLDNEAQLAALLAHELTHFTRRHALRALEGHQNQNRILASLRQAVARLAGAGDLPGLFGDGGSMGAVTGYSREFEAEADRQGLELMVKAGYEPQEALRLFEHLQQEVETQDLREPYFFATHPRLQKRIQNVKAFLESLPPSPSPGIRNREAFLQNIGPVLLDNAFLDLRAGRFWAAQKGAEKYLSLKKDNARAYYLLGEIFRQRGETDDHLRAKRFYEEAIFLDPADPEPHKGIGLVYYKEGEWLLAKRSFQWSLALSPRLPDRGYIEGYLKKCESKGGAP